MRNLTIKRTINIEIDVDVYGKYHKGKAATYYDPCESAEFEIKQVMWKGIDITKFLIDTDLDWYNLEEKCLNEIEERDLQYED